MALNSRFISDAFTAVDDARSVASERILSAASKGTREVILLGNPYSIREGIVYWRQQPVLKAEPTTFHHLGGDWGRDAERVFVATHTRKVDAASFQDLNPVFAKDANAAYDREGPIKGADAESFKALDAGVHIGGDEIVPMISARGYASDRKSVFYHDQGFGRATTLRGADVKSFVSLRIDYGHDSNGVWFQKTRLPKADPMTWVHLGGRWSADRERVYFAEREVPGVKRESLTIVAAPGLAQFATDCERFFMAERPVTEQYFWATIAKAVQNYEKGLSRGLSSASRELHHLRRIRGLLLCSHGAGCRRLCPMQSHGQVPRVSRPWQGSQLAGVLTMPHNPSHLPRPASEQIGFSSNLDASGR